MSGGHQRGPRQAEIRLENLLRYLAVMGAPLPISLDLPADFSPRRRILDLDAQVAPMFRRAA